MTGRSSSEGPNPLTGRLARLIADHAVFERSRADPDADTLAGLLALPDPPLMVWLAEAGSGEPIGYASASLEWSTWSLAPYLHMDCLYLAPAARNKGVGARLLQAVTAEADRRGLARIEWQTPSWNRDAARFYRRHGARGAAKHRFTLPRPAGPSL